MNKIKIILSAVVFTGFAAISLLGANIPLKMTVSVDRDKILIGDKFTLTVKIEADKSIELVEFNPIDLLSRSFEVKDYKVNTPGRRWGKLKHEYSYLLSTFTTGDYKIPELVLKYRKKGKEDVREFKSSPIVVKVESVPSKPGDKDDIRDLKGIERPGVSPLWIILLVIVVLSAVGYFIWRHFKNKRNRSILTDLVDARPADEVAMERLKKLKESTLIEEGNSKEYYIYLSEIIRQYVEKRYDMSVLDRTTMELFRQLRGSEVDRKVVMEIKSLLDDCDLVKFAKYMPLPKEVETNWECAFSVVEKTRVVENIGTKEDAAAGRP